MHRLLTLLAFGLLSWSISAAEVLIVADEFPAMRLLATALKSEEGLTSRITAQSNLPPDLSGFASVIVYIHRDLSAPVEEALIAYTQGGGRLVALHHSISSGKARNRQWFGFLGVRLPKGEVSAGGYKWIENVTLDVVNLAPNHFITTNRVRYPEQIQWQLPNAPEQTLPGFRLEKSEVYLNHVLTGASRTRLLGLKYKDTSGKVFMQDHAGWIKQSGRGWIVYFLPGHSSLDFEQAAYARMIANAVVWKP